MGLGSRYWTTRFAEWAPPIEARPGYTLLVPVPGDLPVFLEVALAVCSLQDPANRLRTLVIPDVDTPQVRNILERFRPTWSGDIDLLLLPQPERTVLPRLKNPSRNHAVQVIAGIEHSPSTHVLLHDADLFLLDKGAHDQRYRQAVERDLDALGISPVWDGWYAEHGLELAATWELIARRDWLRAFPPYMHMGHTAELFGEDHVFDTTLRAQALSNPARIAHDDLSNEIVHFNYVISTYRHLQRSTGSFLDDRFRLVLIRLLIDLFADEPFDYEVPTLDELAAGLTDASRRVVYPSGEEHAANYASFRSQISRTFDGQWCTRERSERAQQSLGAFDAFYGYQA